MTLVTSLVGAHGLTTIKSVLNRASQLIVGVILAVATAAFAQDGAWEFRNGQWQPIAQPATRPATEPTLDKVERLLARGKHREARELVLAWEKKNKASPVRDRAIYLLADAYFQYGDRVRSFYHLDELMDVYPESPLYYQSLQKQYEIADAFLNGYKLRFLGMPILPADDKAIEMLFRIQQRSPGSPLAEQSLLRTADHYYANVEYDLSAAVYSQYVRSYPRSSAAPQARLRAAYSNLAQFRGLMFDPTPLVDARVQLVELNNSYPEFARDNSVSAVIDRIDATMARKLYSTAQFYRRTNEPKAAGNLYRQIIKEYPRTEEATRAQQALAVLPPEASAPPTTQPVAQ